MAKANHFRFLCFLLLMPTIVYSSSESDMREIGVVSDNDWDGDGTVNNEDVTPLLSGFPILHIGFSQPVIGIRYKITGSISHAETRSLTNNSTNTSTKLKEITDTSTLTRKNEYTDKVAIGLKPESGKISFLPSLDASFENANTNTDTFESVSKTKEEQQILKEQKTFDEAVSKSQIDYQSNDGYIQSSMEVRNYSKSPVKMKNFIIAINYQDDDGGLRSFANDIDLRKSNLEAKPAPSVDEVTQPATQSEYVSFEVPIARNSSSAVSKAIHIHPLNIASVIDLTKKKNVMPYVEEAVITWNNKEYSLTEYQQILSDLNSSLVRLRILTNKIDRSFLVGSKNTSPVRLAEIIESATGEKVEQRNYDGKEYIVSMLNYVSDFSWGNLDSLTNADPELGRWAIFINSSEATSSSETLKILPGQVVDIIYISNEDLQGRVFSSKKYSGNFTITPNGTLGQYKDLDDSKIYVINESLPPGSVPGGKICFDQQIRSGDVVSLSVKFKVSPNETIRTAVSGTYPNRPDNNTQLENCPAFDRAPLGNLIALSPEDLQTSIPGYFSFGKEGPQIRLDKLSHQLPNNQFKYYSDGTFVVRYLIDDSDLNTPSNICLGLDKVLGKGIIGRYTSIAPPGSGNAGSLGALITRLHQTNCHNWVNENPEQPEKEFLRTVEADFSLSLNLSAKARKN